jgi:hypothetical protein
LFLKKRKVMKKIYQIPTIIVVKLKANKMLSGSPAPRMRGRDATTDAMSRDGGFFEDEDEGSSFGGLWSDDD